MLSWNWNWPLIGLQLDDAPLMSDYPRLWLTTYNMLEALLARRLVISTILDNIEPSAFDKEAVTVTEQEWALIEDIVTVLEAFKVTPSTFYLVWTVYN